MKPVITQNPHYCAQSECGRRSPSPAPTHHDQRNERDHTHPARPISFARPKRVRIGPEGFHLFSYSLQTSSAVSAIPRILPLLRACRPGFRKRARSRAIDRPTSRGQNRPGQPREELSPGSNRRRPSPTGPGIFPRKASPRCCRRRPHWRNGRTACSAFRINQFGRTPIPKVRTSVTASVTRMPGEKERRSASGAGFINIATTMRK